MNYVLAVVVLAALAVVATAQPSAQALENIDVDNVLKNDKLVRRYIDCVLERGRCEKNGNDLKGMSKMLILLLPPLS